MINDKSQFESRKMQELQEGKSIVEKDILTKKTAEKSLKEKRKSIQSEYKI